MNTVPHQARRAASEPLLLQAAVQVDRDVRADSAPGAFDHGTDGLKGSGRLHNLESGRLWSNLAYLWKGPATLIPSLRLEWRFVLIRWLAIIMVAPGLLLMDLPSNFRFGANVILLIASVYNLGVFWVLRTRPSFLANGYLTTAADAALNIAMMMAAGGFDSPLYYILYTVTISAAMRYGYVPAVGMALTFISLDILESLVLHHPSGTPVIVRSSFLLVTALLAGYLREEARQAQASLQARLQEANALNQELESFSYSISHDLRAPLRSIDGFSQALLEDYVDKLDDEGQDYLCRIRGASQRMAQLTDDLLALFRVTRRELKMEMVDLSAMVRAVVEELRKSEPSRQVDVVVAPGLEVRGDPLLLRVALENLLGNAWKFTSKHPKSRIECGLARQDDRKVYYVRDDGAGFDPAFASKLFHPFQRLHQASEFSGTGIGLATVQRIIRSHGGTVWAEGAVEQGATFYFTLT